jgi:signal peptidase I
MAEPNPPTPRQPKKKILFTSFGVFLLFVLAFVVFFYFNFRTVEVKGPSMEPTLTQGRRVLVSSAYWLIGEIKKGDIVVLRSPKDEAVVIKRVYALGGQPVDLINVPEDWSLLKGEYRVPDGEVFVLGDNSPMSEDSRVFGSVEPSRLIGKVVLWNY